MLSQKISYNAKSMRFKQAAKDTTKNDYPVDFKSGNMPILDDFNM